MIYILLGALAVCSVILALWKPPKKREPEGTPKKPDFLPESAPCRIPPEPPVIRRYEPGPALTRNDDALYAVIHAALAQALTAEGVNPEGGFKIRSVKPVRETGAKPLSPTENEALYAVISAAIAQTLSADGINPEGGFAIRSLKPLAG